MGVEALQVVVHLQLFRGGYDYNNLGQSEMKGAYATQDTVTFEIKGDTLVGILEKQAKNNRLR